MTSASDYPEPPQDNGEPRYLVYEKIMISAIISLLLVAFVVFLLHVYARWFSGRFFRRTRRRSASTGARFYFSGAEPERLWNVGLDSAILGTLPMFLYQSQNFTDGLECPVCLCEFEENEKGRLLPNCKHSFHVECIDMWFRSHSTCPICRTGAQPEQPVLESARTEQVSVTIPGPITSGFQDNLNLQQELLVSRRRPSAWFSKWFAEVFETSRYSPSFAYEDGEQRQREYSSLFPSDRSAERDAENNGEIQSEWV